MPNAWWAVDESISCFRGKIHVDSYRCKCSNAGDVMWNESICCPANSSYDIIWGNCQCLYGFSMSEDNECVGKLPSGHCD